MKRALRMKIGNLCKALKYHWLLLSIWNQEGSTEENLNCSKNIFFSKWQLGMIFNAACRHFSCFVRSLTIEFYQV